MKPSPDGETRWRVKMRGGTDLLPSMKQKLFTPAYVLDLRGLANCGGFACAGNGVELGADDAHRDRTLAIIRRITRAVRSGEDGASASVAHMGHWRQRFLERLLWYNSRCCGARVGFCLKKTELMSCSARGNFCWATFSAIRRRAAVPGSGSGDCRAEGLRRTPLSEFY